MQTPVFVRSCWYVVMLCVSFLSGCGGGSSTTAAGSSDVVVLDNQPGVSPFINLVRFQGASLGQAVKLQYTIAAKPGATAKAVNVTYEIDALKRRGFIDGGAKQLTLPVFGLYANYVNTVTVNIIFDDASQQSMQLSLPTAPYVDPDAIYDHPTIIVKRDPAATFGFGYFAIKSGLGTPIVIDTDGEIRWRGVGVTNSAPSAFRNGGFVVGDQTSPTFWRVELDGGVSRHSIATTTYTRFHHNIDLGKAGYIGEVRATVDGVVNFDTIAAEFDENGVVIKQFDLADILSTYMRSQGDDPSNFIRPGADWFHMNATTYDPQDDSLIVSSRENFVLKIDYRTGALRWILGDPTKYWYSFASLRSKALTLADGGLYPIGQHGTSLTSDGLLMLFNDGAPSFNQAGAPVGSSRTYSAVSAYSISPSTLTAREVWRFDYEKSIYSDICSSAYEGPEKSVLVTFATAENRKAARLVGLDANHKVVFDFKYASPVQCGTAWNAIPVAFEAIQIH